MVFFITLTIILVFVLQKIFYLLFNYEISKFLRSYSFWLILGELLIQNNIEFFTFVGFRAFQTSFAFSFVSKCMNAFSILFLFLVIFATFTSYVIYYTQYGKLARYFLINMYRFPSSYALMIVCYGIRPFLKGIIHAMLY